MTTSTATRTVSPSRRSGREPALLRFVKRLPARTIVLILIVVEVYPLFWLLMNSFKTQEEYLNDPVWSLPKSFGFANYVSAFTTGNLGRYMLNSVLAVAPSLVLIIVLGVAAGFALEVMVWKGRGTVLLIILGGVMVPGQMILLPLFTIYFQTGLTGTLWPLIITYTGTGLPLTIFMMATYFRAVPREVFEASTLDGASIIRSFWSIGFPMVRNAVFTVALVQFFFIWNDLLIALTFTNSTELSTIQVGLLNFNGQYGTVQYGPLFAAICANVFAILILYLFLNQRVMRGLAAGSVKG
jgi:raffinose/stachyose/melibiose transport system permease protein